MIRTVNEISKNLSTTAELTGRIALHDEHDRLAALKSYHILDTAEEEDFDDLTELASTICQTPVSLISLVDGNRQWFKSHSGISITETPKEFSFCAHAIARPNDIMIVKDAKEDLRFADNPLVYGELNITFYTGVPLVNQDGFALGSLCVIDTVQRELSEQQLKGLKTLARQVVDKLELRRKMMELETVNSKLSSSYDSLKTIQKKNERIDHRLKNLVEQAPVAIATLKGENMVIEMANDTILQIWNKESDIIGKPIVEALPELVDSSYLKLLMNVFKTGKPYFGSEARTSVGKSGRLKDAYFNFAFQPLLDDVGLMDSIMIVATNVTEQVESKQNLSEANHRLEIALDAAKFGSYDLELASGKMMCTDQCKMNFGVSTNARFDLEDLFQSIVPEYRDYVNQQIKTAIENNSIYATEYQIAWPGGGNHWIAAYGKPIYNSEGKAERMIGVTQDITERKLLDQHKDDFLSIASHELKTPITSLKSSLQLLDRLKDEPASKTSTRLIELANKSVEKISTLVDQLLNFNRIDHDQLYLNKTTFNVADMLSQCCNHIRLDGRYHLALQGENNISVLADEDKIDQVVVNFVNNAVKYAPDSKTIYLKVELVENNQVKVSVRDTGKGISEERQKHIFERYYRADHTSTNYSGLGLGLYISAEIIHKHGGEIGIISKENEGSTFWFTLPLHKD